jgi:hypothetical protein
MLATLALLAPTTAIAGDFGSIRMPLTPVDYRDHFLGLKKKKGAATVQWTSRNPGFTCRGDGDFVEVRVDNATWPSVVPDKVYCDSELGTVKMKVQLYDEVLRSQFVGDGTLVLARAFGESAEWEGVPPRKDLPVQQGNTGDTGLYCKVQPGPILLVRAKQTAEDASGKCVLRTNAGGQYEVPIVLRSAYREAD